MAHLPSRSGLDTPDVFITDFRSAYATVLDLVLGVDPTSFLGGSLTALPFL